MSPLRERHRRTITKYRGSATGSGGGTTNPDALITRIRAELKIFTDWLASGNAKGFIGEVGWPKTNDSTAWNLLADYWYTDADSSALWVAYWATGEWWAGTEPWLAYEEISTGPETQPTLNYNQAGGPSSSGCTNSTITVEAGGHLHDVGGASAATPNGTNPATPAQTYTFWNDLPGAWNQVRWTCRPDLDTQTANAGYYWALQGNIRNAANTGTGSVWYAGIQSRAPNPKGIIFSIWEATTGVAGSIPGTVSQAFSGEGIGWQLLADYSWIAGRTYSIRVEADTARGPRWFAAYFKDTVTEVETWLGSIQASSIDGSQLAGVAYQWTELFSQVTPATTCPLLPRSTTFFGTPTFSSSGASVGVNTARNPSIVIEDHPSASGTVAVDRFTLLHGGVEGSSHITRDYRIEHRTSTSDPWTTLVTVTGNTNNNPTHILSAAVATKEIRIVVTDPSTLDNATRIYELEIRNGAGGTNIALNKPVTVSHTRDEVTEGGRFLVDGSTSTKWCANPEGITGSEPDIYIDSYNYASEGSDLYSGEVYSLDVYGGLSATTDTWAIVDLRPNTYMRGISVAGGEFGSTFPGTYDTHYHYDSQATFDYLYSRGIRMVRLPIKWERIQRSLGGALDSGEQARVLDFIERAGIAGGLRPTLNYTEAGGPSSSGCTNSAVTVSGDETTHDIGGASAATPAGTNPASATGTFTFWNDVAGTFKQSTWKLRVTLEPPSTTGHYWFQQGFIESASGGPGNVWYAGIQTNGQVPSPFFNGKVVNFSIWNAIGAVVGNLSNTYAGAFSGEGSGYRVAAPYPWVQGRTYTFRVQADATRGSRWFAAYIRDTVTGIESWIGSIQAGTTDSSLLRGVAYQIGEPFISATPNVTSCTLLPRSTAVFTKPTFVTATGGLRVVLDIHNYGRYNISGTEHAIGGGTVTQTHFNDLWTRLSGLLQNNPYVEAYGLMNEPHDMPSSWQTSSQSVVNAIRTAEGSGAHKLLIVPLDSWSGAQSALTAHPSGPWVVDTANNIRYEAHHYWDRDNSGDYPDTYAAEVSDAVSRGYAGGSEAVLAERTLSSNTATTGTGSATTLSVSPTGMATNDWLIFSVVSVGGAATHTNTAGGCTQVGSGLTQSSTTTLSRWKKKAGASEAGPYTFDVGASLRISIAVRAYTGGDPTDIIEEATTLQGTSAQNLAITGVDPTANGRWHILHEASNSAAGASVSFTQPTNYNEKHDFASAHTTNANACLGWAERSLPDDAATGTKTFSISGGTDRAIVGGSITLKPGSGSGGGGSPPPTGLVLGHWRNRPIDSGTSWRTDMNAAEATFGVFEGHWSNYKGSGSAGTLNAAETTALNDGKKLHIYWKPWSTTWANVVAGGRDSVIDAAAASLGARSENIWLTIGHEPEDNTGPSGFSEADYRGMWQRVRDRFDLAGVDNITWVWVFQTHLNRPDLLPGLWPGNGLVDIVAPQPYIVCSASASILAQKWIDCIDWLTDNRDSTHHWAHTDLPIAITEWGADLGGNTAPCGTGDRGTAQHRADAIDGVRNRLSEIAALNVVELRFFDAGSNYLENKPSVDAVAYQALKNATEA